MLNMFGIDKEDELSTATDYRYSLYPQTKQKIFQIFRLKQGK